MNLTPETVAELVETLRYLKREFDQGFRLDSVNMLHVERALARVEIEQMMQREAFKIAAE